MVVLDFLKKDKSKLLLIILSIILAGLSTYFADKANTVTDDLIHKKDTIDSLIVNTTNTKTILYSYMDSVSFLSEIPADTITIIEYGDSIHIVDSVNITDSLLIRDSIIYKEAKRYRDKPMGSIILKDSTNKFTNIKVLVDFPFGRREVTYFDKYEKVKTSQFKKYIGLGYGSNDMFLSGDIYYHNIGLGITVGTNGGTQYYIKYKL